MNNQEETLDIASAIVQIFPLVIIKIQDFSSSLLKNQDFSTSEVFSLLTTLHQNDFDATTTQQMICTFRQIRNLARIFLNTNWLYLTSPSVFPKFANMFIQLEICLKCLKWLILCKYTAHNRKYAKNCNQNFPSSRLLDLSTKK